MRSLCLGLLSVCLSVGLLQAEDKTSTVYDPLAKLRTEMVIVLDTTIRDEARQRDIPIRVYRCRDVKSAPVVLFSHGLGGSREGSPFLGQHWAARGYVAVFLQHPGSDTAVWKNRRLGERLAALKTAANAENFLLRAKDVSAVLDQLQAWNTQSGHELSETMNLQQVGMSGHSFGAVTTQAVSGQTLPTGRAIGRVDNHASQIMAEAKCRKAMKLRAVFS